MTTRPATSADGDFVRAALEQAFSSVMVARRGELVDASSYPAVVAEIDGDLVGVVTIDPSSDRCELVAVAATRRGHGVGGALLDAADDAARAAGCTSIWLITTNHNTDAIRLYQRRGFDIVALHRFAVDDARRRLKPSIPAEIDGIPLRHEIEMERPL